MSWDALGAIGEIVGAGAVVVTLIYLSLQIRHNSKTTRALTYANSTDAWQSYLLSQSVEDLEILIKLSTDEQELSAAEFMRAYYLCRTMFRRMENDYYQYRAGIFDEPTWQGYLEAWRQDNLRAPGVRAMWELQADLFNNEFAEYFGRMVAEVPSAPTHLRQEFRRALAQDGAAASR